MEYNPSDIFTQSDLEKIIKSNTIDRDIIIRGEHIRKLEKVEKILGFLGISDSSIESLGDLIEITGDFWTSFHTVFSPLNSLGQLEKVGGDASFRYSNISDLGNLKYVGGKLSLRDTPISNLGNLEFVGGDLYLPKRLKDTIDLSDVQVMGKIQFWNDSKTKKQITDKTALELEKSEIPIPYWAHEYVYSIDALRFASEEQKRYYDHFKNLFLNARFTDLEGNDNYVFILFYDIIDDYKKHEDISLLQQQFADLEIYYPKSRNYTSLAIIEEYEKLSDYDNAWKFLKLREYISVQTVWEYEQKLKQKLLDADLMIRLCGYSHLTDFGKNNIDRIKPFAEKYLQTYEEEKKTNFLDLFFKTSGRYKASREETILNELRIIVKKAEDLYRTEIGMPKIGEGWISETELYYKLKETFSGYQVVHQGNPAWLARQRLDIYFPSLNIAIEYQGKQHYEPVDFFGGREAFEKNLARDEQKRKLCEINNCVLIYVSEKYDFDKLVLEIKEKIELISK